MDLDRLREVFRREVSDEATPYLWGDDEVLDFVVAAQDEFVRLIGGITDATSDLTEIAIVESEAFADHSPYILRIRSIRRASDNEDISVINEADLKKIGFLDYGRIVPMKLDDTEGPVEYALLGLEDNKIRWVKVPEADDTALLHVLRYPYPRITAWPVAGGSVQLEIEEFHHRSLLMWMKHLAYSKEDGETYDPKLAAQNEAAFEKYCTRVAKEKERKRFKPRTVQYGGIGR